MNWFFLALLAPILWGIVNHVDKYLLSVRFRGRGVGVLVIYSSLISVVTLPIFYFLSPSLWDFSFLVTFFLFSSGLFYGFSVWFYFLSLREGDAAIVTSFFLTIPIFGFLFSFFVLGEKIFLTQIIGALIILVGLLLLSLKNERQSRLIYWPKKLIFFALVSSLFSSIHGVLFKFATKGELFWPSVFWQNTGLLFVGLFLFLLIKNYRQAFFQSLRENPVLVSSVNLLNESLTVLGNLFLYLALSLAPVALVLTVSSFQPAIVLVLGFVGQRFFGFTKTQTVEPFSIWRVVGIVMLVFGSYLIYR